MIDNEIIELVERTLNVMETHKERIRELTQYNVTSVLHDFKTLSLKAPRGLGTTTAAAQLVMQYPKSLLVSPSTKLEKRIAHDFGIKSFTNVYSIEKIHISSLGFSEMDLIIFDPWTSFERDNKLKTKAYEFMYRVLKDVKLFVLLG